MLNSIMDKLEYQELIHKLRGERNYLSSYKYVVSDFPRIKFNKHSRNKKCRGYYRKLYQVSILPFNIYLNGIESFYEYMRELPKDERDDFDIDYIKPFEEDVVDNVLKLASDYINGKVKIRTRQVSSPSGVINGYRLILYKFIRNNSFYRFWYSLDEMKVTTEIINENKWDKIYIPYEY